MVAPRQSECMMAARFDHGDDHGGRIAVGRVVVPLAMTMEVVSPLAVSWFRCCWGRGCPLRLSSAMSMGRCPWSPACSLGEVPPGDGVEPRPPLRELGPVVIPGRHAVISCIGVHRLVGCARHRASVVGPSTPRCGARSGSHPAPLDRGVS